MSSFSWVPSKKSERLSVFLRKQEGVAIGKQLSAFTTASQFLNCLPSPYFQVCSSRNSQLRGKLNQQNLTGRKTSFVFVFCFFFFLPLPDNGRALSSGRVCIMGLLNIMPPCPVVLVLIYFGPLQRKHCFWAFLDFVKHEGRGLG